MRHEEMRRKLIDGTIHVIAQDGLDKATTKQIRITTNANEAYIYRCFADKEDMFAKAFEVLDAELADKVMHHVEVMYMQKVDYETRCRFFFSSIWEFMLSSRDKCITYVRYYYSPYFQQYSAENHRCRYEPILEKFKDAFRDEADVWLILNHILNVMLDFAVKVHTGEMPNEEVYAEHVFRVIYVSVRQYFRKNGESDS